MTEQRKITVCELVFRNLLNGVPAETIAETFKLAPAEVMREFTFALKKIRSYAFENRMPPIMVDTVAQARAREHKLALLTIVERLNLSRDPVYPKITYAKVEDVISAG